MLFLILVNIVLENLNYKSRSHNSQNRPKNSNCSSQYTGVYKNNRNKWISEIRKDNKKYSLGSYDNEKDAAIAYNIKAIELFGNDATLNSI